MRVAGHLFCDRGIETSFALALDSGSAGATVEHLMRPPLNRLSAAQLVP